MDDIARRRGRSLPHWSRPDGTYFLTFRTHDAIPVEVALQHKEEFGFDLRRLERELGHPPSREEARAVFTERYRRAERYLETGHGACLLRDPARPGSSPTRSASSTATATTSTRGA